jgi:AraC-like DNA-binding protein
LHVVAFLPRHLLGHLRTVLGNAHSLSAATDAAELYTMLAAEDPDLLVLDPAARDGAMVESIEALIGRHPGLPVIVYTTLTPQAMRLVVRLARVGVQHVVLNRFDDEPRRFLDLIERVPAHPLSELLLEQLAEPMRQLPVVLARAIEQLVRSPSRAASVPELAALAGMTSRTLYRYMTPARLPPRELIVCARLLRAYTFLRAPDSRLKEVSVKLGYTDPTRLSEQLRDWTGFSPKELRHAAEPTEFVRRLVERLRRSDVEDEQPADAG